MVGCSGHCLRLETTDCLSLAALQNVTAPMIGWPYRLSHFAALTLTLIYSVLHASGHIVTILISTQTEYLIEAKLV